MTIKLFEASRRNYAIRKITEILITIKFFFKKKQTKVYRLSLFVECRFQDSIKAFCNMDKLYEATL